MNKFGLIKSLTDDFLPHIASRTEQMEARPILSVERLRFYTGSAIEIFSRRDCQLRLWGYSSAFNPLAYVETIMPPNFHYLIQIGNCIIDPIRTALSKRPHVYQIGTPADEFATLSAYGHPSRWLRSSGDLSQYVWTPDDAIELSINSIFHDQNHKSEGSFQIRTDNAILCTLPPGETEAAFAKNLVHRAFLAGCKKASLSRYTGSNWEVLDSVCLPEPQQFFASRVRASGSQPRIYRLPGRSYALHLLATALGLPQANVLLRNLTRDLRKNETRLQPIEELLELHVSASPYEDQDIAFHVREKISDPAILHPIYIDAAQPLKSPPAQSQTRQYAPRRRKRSHSRTK